MFTARHEIVTHRISLPLPASEAIELFTPEGERLWIAEWNPRYFYPANGETLEGMVFTTGAGEELTYWTVVDCDLPGLRARYARVTPGSRSTMIDVRCHQAGEGQCEVEVTYTLTGLSEAGNAVIDSFVAEYRAMIDGWREKILEHLQRMPHRVTAS